MRSSIPARCLDTTGVRCEPSFILGGSGRTVVALVADHGMEGVNKVVTINTVLQRAGLLVLDDQGRVDLSRTRALYPTVNTAHILINSQDRRGGIVRPEERAGVIAVIRRALEEVRDGGR